MNPTTKSAAEEIEYPTSDGRPMAETDIHRKRMADLIETLEDWFAADPSVYVSGNLLLFYVPGDRRRHLSPDVFVVRDVPKHDRPNYLVWREGKGPDFVIELTSSSTRDEDVEDKMQLYRDTLRVLEYFLFDPLGDYLEPAFQGYRLSGGDYEPIAPVEGRLPSAVLNLHLFRDGTELRLWDPTTGQRLPTRAERAAAAEAARQRAEAELRLANTARQEIEAENERLRRELEELKRRLSGEP